MSRNDPLQDRIPADLSDRISKAFTEQLTHENFRNKVKEIFDDCTNSVPFMDKVKGYASKEIDEKIFRNGGAIIFWLLSILGAAVLGAIATKYIR